MLVPAKVTESLMRRPACIQPGEVLLSVRFPVPGEKLVQTALSD